MQIAFETARRLTPLHVFNTSMPVTPGALWTKECEFGEDSSMNVNGSSSSVEFVRAVPTGKILFLHRLITHLVDVGIEVDEFGGLGSSLTNGVLYTIKDSSDNILATLGGEAIKSNHEFSHFGEGGFTSELAGSAEEYLGATLDFGDVFGGTPVLTAGEYVSVLVQDDLTNLTDFECSITGLLFDT